MYLQLEILWETCRTDAEIRHALTALPKNIEETYKRCVCRIDFQDDWALKVLKWVSFAKRPLHIEELREAVAFRLTDTKWDADKKPQRDFIVGCCANLIVLDPIDNCLRFAHSSVKQYLEEDGKKMPEERSVPGYSTEESGDLECGEYCITYLSFSDFSSLQLSKISSKKTAAAIPSPYSVVQSMPNTGLYKLFFRKPQNKINTISVSMPTPAAPSRANYRFLDYAIANWALHTKQIHQESSGWENFMQLAMHFNATWNFHPWVSGGRSKTSHLHGLFGWAVKERHRPLLSLLADPATSHLHLLAREIAANVGSPLYLFCDVPVVDEGLPALHIASKLGYEDIVRILLKFCDINNVDKDGCTPLHHAASNGHTDIVRLFLQEKRIKFDVNSRHHCTPLSLAASHGHHDVLSLLIDKGANIDSEGILLRLPPLRLALENEHYFTANLLLEKGAQIRWLDTNQQYFVTDIAKRGPYLIRMLAINDTEYTPEEAALLLELIQMAIESRMQALAKLVIRRSMYEVFNYKMLASLAIQSNHLAAEWMLEDSGEARDPSSIQELLLSAAKEGHTRVVELILKKDVDPNVKDKVNATPLHWAAWSGNTPTMAILLKEGAKVDAKDMSMETPLHWAAKADRVAAITLLLQVHANIYSEDELGRTPLHEAARHGHKAAIKLLLESGAKINSKDRRDMTPLDLVRRAGDIGSVNLLLERGAVRTVTNTALDNSKRLKDRNSIPGLQ